MKARVEATGREGSRFSEKRQRQIWLDETNPIKDVTALRNLALALNCNPRDTEAARLASNLLLQHVWCPPAAPAVLYQKDALLAATFAPGGSNNEIFAVGGDGQLLFWNGERSLSPTPQSLFEKPKPDNPQQIVQHWLCLLQPRRTMAVDCSTNACIGCRRRERRARRASTGSTARTRRCSATSHAKFRSGDGRCRIERTSPRAKTWKFSGFEVPASILPGLTSQIGLSLSMRAARTRPNVPFSRSREPSGNSSIDRGDSLT